ncbi:unnamed protein product [Caretta caretta]
MYKTVTSFLMFVRIMGSLRSLIQLAGADLLIAYGGGAHLFVWMDKNFLVGNFSLWILLHSRMNNFELMKFSTKRKIQFSDISLAASPFSPLYGLGLHPMDVALKMCWQQVGS